MSFISTFGYVTFWSVTFMPNHGVIHGHDVPTVQSTNSGSDRGVGDVHALTVTPGQTGRSNEPVEIICTVIDIRLGTAGDWGARRIILMRKYITE